MKKMKLKSFDQGQKVKICGLMSKIFSTPITKDEI